MHFNFINKYMIIFSAEVGFVIFEQKIMLVFKFKVLTGTERYNCISIDRRNVPLGGTCVQQIKIDILLTSCNLTY